MRGQLGLGLLLLVMMLSSCAESASPGQPPPSPSALGSPSTGSSAADLTIVVDDGQGSTTTWRLTCDPPGGDHPDPAAACAALAAHGERALPPVAKDRACSQVYGGSRTATVTGTWRGQAVNSRFSLVDGCQIARWKSLVGLLPAAGA
jgi:Subtilisin inhibitor-like